MIKSEYKVIGVMSGTSLDGIDMAYITFVFAENISFEIHFAETVAYSNSWQKQLKSLVDLDLKELEQIDKLYTAYISEKLNSFISRNQITQIDAICSHGHTALHRPEEGLTFQIGNLPELSQNLKQTVVCDFRVQDVAFGGQGAPLVPIGDQLLFSEYKYCINLGGFANLSFEENDLRIAYDICPVNIVLNHYAKVLGHEFDAEGEIAANGKINIELLDALNNLPFYKKEAPKSLGLEWVNSCVFPLIKTFDIMPNDVIATFTEHIAIQISSVIKMNSKVLFSGGGTFNTFLLKRIATLTKSEMIIPENKLVEFKEALIFGLLGVLKLRNEINCLSSVTGARRDHSSGQIYYP